MSNKMIQNTRAFGENINILLDELKLAMQWERPSILVAIYKSESGKEKIGKALKDGLEKLGQQTVFIEIGKERPSIFPFLRQAANREKTVFLISNIDRGGGGDGKDAYRALNLNREFLVEYKIRAVFLLSQNEASSLPRFAPDFWAFRHRAIEFIGSRAAKENVLPSGVLIWHSQDAPEPPQTLEEKIAAREKFLGQLFPEAEALSARSELLYSLGHLYWMLGNSSKASESLTAGLHLAEKYDAPRATWFSNALAIICYEEKKYREAAGMYQRALAASPKDGLICFNSSVTARALGRNLEAMTMGRRAAGLNPSSARIWNGLGYLYIAIGKPDEAVAYFEKSAELAPTASNYLLSLAIGCWLTNDREKSIRQLKIARQLGSDSINWFDACEKILLGNKAGAMNLLRTALRTNQISKTEILRDPNMNLLLDAGEIQNLCDDLLT